MAIEDQELEGLDVAGDGAWRYESFVVRVSMLSTGAVRMVRLEDVRTGEVGYVADLLAAFQAIDARIAGAGGATVPGSPSPGDAR